MPSLTRIQLVLALLLGGTLLALPVWPQVHPMDAEHSVITVHVFKSGLFSAFADNTKYGLLSPAASWTRQDGA
jgi:hypothetical protein